MNTLTISKITEKQLEETEAKFKLWQEKKKEGRRENLILFRDPTIWAYANLKDEENKPLKLYPYQDLIINNDKRHIAFCAARQIGKTTMLCVKALHHALFTDNAFVIIVSRSEPQAAHVLDVIKEFMLRAEVHFEEVLGDVQNRMELFLKTSEKSISKILCLPPTE